MPAYPSVDESLDRLHWPGWSVGDYGTPTRCRRQRQQGGEPNRRDWRHPGRGAETGVNASGGRSVVGAGIPALAPGQDARGRS